MFASRQLPFITTFESTFDSFVENLQFQVCSIPSEEKVPRDDSTRNKRDWLVSSARIATPAYLSWASDIIEKSVKSISRFASPTFAYGDCEWFGTDGGGGMNAYTSPPRPK